MASSSTAKESSASSSSFGSSGIKWEYEVFLSFRGEDTRNNFTDHLYTALNHKGIYTFRDDERLERGKEISSELLEAIERSRVSIIVLSKNYASSTLCLEELAKIVECNDMKKQKVFPVFYKVNPSDIRKQMGDFKTAFDKHEEDYKGNLEKVQRWRSALKKVGNLFGWHLQDRSEAELIKLIIDTISRSLNPTFSKVGEDLVGIKSHLKKINDLLESGLDDIRFIGICGMGGIGKTTIARVLYESFSSGDEYQGSCFLADVREVSIKKGVLHLQERLLSKVLGENCLNICDPDEGISYIRRRLCHKRVFVVLDDVDNQLKQLEKLAGKHNWFGSGSRIIITTRDKHVLISHGISSIYEVEGLKNGDALKLFYMKAFRYGQPTDHHDKLSKQIIQYTSGHPLALQVLGSHLCGRTVKEWRSVLKRLRHVPHEEIFEKLRISYDGLSETEKSIFLDIACFFKGKNKDRVMEILDGCDFDSTIGMRELLDKSLITIFYNKLGMHDLLQQMGWEIVRRENRDDRGQWSRLWLFEDVNHVLIENKGTHEVKGIILDKSKQRITHLNSESFSSMRNLRLLKIRNVDLSRDIEYLSNELRLLKWPKYPSNSLPSNFQPHKLFELNLCRSRIQYLWKDMKAFERLKTIKLSYSRKLIETPDFTRVPNLEMLDLEGCTRLCKLHDSIGLLKRLITLNLKGCKNLVSFPSNVSGLKLLKILNLEGCSKLDHLPQNLEELEVLEELDAGETAIRQVPPSIAQLSNLKSLSFRGCKVQGWWSIFLPRKYLSLPYLSGLFRLKRLDLSDCGLSDGSLPSDLGSLRSLKELKLSNNNFVSLPDSIKRLSKLQILNVENCHRLRSLPELPPKIIFVGAEDCISLEDVSNVLRGGTFPSFALHLFNCLKLHENLGQKNNLAIMLLKQYLQQPFNLSFQFHIRLPGFDIPEWFRCKNDGNSVHIGLPPDWLNDDFMGIAMCGVFKPALENLDCMLKMRCTMYIMRKQYDFYFKVPSFKTVGSHHLWLAYMSRVTFEHDTSPQLSYNKPEDENVHVLVGGSTCIHASFRIEYRRSTDYGDDDNDDDHDGDGDGYDKKCKVIKCGIRLVYKQDKNYFQESSAAEGSVFHQNDNCSTGHSCIVRNFLVPTNSQDVHIVAYSMWPKLGVNNDNLYSPAKEPKGKQEQEGKHRKQPTTKHQQKQSKNRATKPPSPSAPFSAERSTQSLKPPRWNSTLNTRNPNFSPYHVRLCDIQVQDRDRFFGPHYLSS